MNLAKNAQTTLEGNAGIEPEAGEAKPIPGDKLAAQAVNFAHSYAMPLTRIWYAKAAFNHLVYQHVMDNMVPGYSQRVEQRMAQRHQGTWWHTGENLPARAPDFGNAVGRPANP
jgi:hypothetical protein